MGLGGLGGGLAADVNAAGTRTMARTAMPPTQPARRVAEGLITCFNANRTLRVGENGLDTPA